jgi:hypothetical protein
MCWFGIVTHEFFFVYHLFDFCTGDLAKNVLYAVSKPHKQLVLLSCVMLMLMYWFSIIGYWQFNDHYEEGARCKSLALCFAETIDQTFKVFFFVIIG